MKKSDLFNKNLSKFQKSSNNVYSDKVHKKLNSVIFSTYKLYEPPREIPTTNPSTSNYFEPDYIQNGYA